MRRGIEISKAQPVTHRSNICSLSFCSQVVLNVSQFLVRYLIDYDRHDPLFSHLWISRNRMFERSVHQEHSRPRSIRAEIQNIRRCKTPIRLTIWRSRRHLSRQNFPILFLQIFLPLFLPLSIAEMLKGELGEMFCV